MSAALVGVSAVAISKEPTRAPAKVFVFMITPPLGVAEAGAGVHSVQIFARFPVETPARSRRSAGVRPCSEAEHVQHRGGRRVRSEEHTSELQSLRHLVCRLLLEKKKEK